MQRQLRKNLLKTYQGWLKWRKVKRKLTPQTAVIFLPQNDTKDNYYALLYLDKFLKKHDYDKAVILTSDSTAVKAADLFSKNISKKLLVSEKTIQCILQFACLYRFDARFFIASLSLPYGRHAERLIGVNKISYAEVFSIGVYQLDAFYKISKPRYKGNDEEIKKFLALGAE